MVKERRYVFDVQDISSVIYACNNCGQETVCKLDDRYRPPRDCPCCSRPLMPTSQESGLDPNEVLLTNLRSVLRLDNPSVRFRFVVPDID